MHDDLEQRKSQHLDLARQPEVEPDDSDALFGCVRLVHKALPELALSDIDLTTRFCGATLRAPLMIVGMTGGTERAARINRDLAQVCEEQGVAFGVGSMRIVLGDPARMSTFDVRPHRPPLLMANLGAQQLVQTPEAAQELIGKLGADGICIHLNPAQELVQTEGDRDFRGCLDAIGALAGGLSERLLVKETGCGVSPAVARELTARGVKAIDVSGAGGTSWTRVEQLRAGDDHARVLGELLSSWGIPTAAAVRSVRAAVGDSTQLLASGGVRTGLDVAKALALGADVAGLALPLFRAHDTGGIDGARAALTQLIDSLRSICLLTGARTPRGLREVPLVLLEPLQSWLRTLGGAQ
ncbi:MAG: type 2 isopentenyl-diphosphate Delta-isomerase [Deltaproteobacteria bacterium]|nr:type 2 isopentenyl-diphosphate Delta-isomerase [Deltaproteobacteria bacterium]